ncbi:DEAD/DEAH box helicase [Paenarthrobacter sp. Z7-10]|uniref:DEAD/DEAH box helicase n=1 Tax=Paenarthrobacter sp. Z7-10 TaxID=2787635 RepID=UPI002E75F2A1|nr:DEAD/DEAH box helicase [Paenarthrobacter sp. Z7-10]
MESDSEQLRHLAAETFGWTSFREGQQEAIEAAVSGGDVLAVLPSGHGKSAVHQITALLRDGLAVVVSPLIALQADQLENLNEMLGEERAVVVNSAGTKRSRDGAWDAVGLGRRRIGTGEVPIPDSRAVGQRRGRGPAAGYRRGTVRAGHSALCLGLGA